MNGLVIFYCLVALCLTIIPAIESQSLTLFFTYVLSSSSYPSVCGTGALACRQSGTNYNCSSLISGTHYYYPSVTGTSEITSWVVGPLPATCGGYSGDNLFPI